MKLHRLDLGELHDDYVGQWVDIKYRPSAGDAREVRRMSLAAMTDAGITTDIMDAVIQSVKTENGDEPSGVSIPLGAIDALASADLVLIRTAVVAWSLKTDDGEAIPVGQKGIDHPEFPNDLADWLGTAIKDHQTAVVRSKSGVDSTEPEAGLGDGVDEGVGAAVGA